MDLHRQIEWAVTLTGRPPRATDAFYVAGSYDDAVNFGKELALKEGRSTREVSVFFRLRLTALSTWHEIESESEYRTEIDAATTEITHAARQAIIDDLT